MGTPVHNSSEYWTTTELLQYCHPFIRTRQQLRNIRRRDTNFPLPRTVDHNEHFWVRAEIQAWLELKTAASKVGTTTQTRVY